ncbi:MAG: site-2 protease family protein [Streptosporangiaceae bacterium]
MTRPPAGPPMGAPAGPPAGPPARQPGDSGPAGSSADRGRRGGFRIAGIPVNFTPGAALLGVLAAGFGALTLPDLDPGRSVAGYLAAAAGVVVVLLGSMVAHELAHSIMARRYGFRVPATVGFFGGLRHGRAYRPGSAGELELPSPRAQWRVAAAGPLTSLLLGGVGAAAAVTLSALGAGLLPVAVAAAAAWINGLLAVANLVPGAGLDGGRIVRALAWARSGDPDRAGLIAARFGQVSGAILTAAGVTALALGHLTGLWFGLMGLLMVAASRAEATQVRTSAALAGIRVRDILLPDGGLAPTARGWQAVQAFLEDEGGEGLARTAVTAYPVRDFDGQLSGLVTLTQLLGVPADRREGTRLSQVATPVAYLAFTTLDEPLTDLRARLTHGGDQRRPASPAALHTAGYALVLGPSGELAGLLRPADFARAAQVGGLRFTTAGAGPGPR